LPAGKGKASAYAAWLSRSIARTFPKKARAAAPTAGPVGFDDGQPLGQEALQLAECGGVEGHGHQPHTRPLTSHGRVTGWFRAD